MRNGLFPEIIDNVGFACKYGCIPTACKPYLLMELNWFSCTDILLFLYDSSAGVAIQNAIFCF